MGSEMCIRDRDNILFPRFIEAHSHIDKSFTWEEFPNLRSNYDGALSINLQEHKTRNTKKVLERAEKSLNLAIKNGYRAIRSHIDTYQNQGNDVWKDLFKLQKNILLSYNFNLLLFRL